MVGSSPLTRGKPWRKVTPGKTDGLIPAHAGKTRARRAGRGKSRAHPRSRGENLVRHVEPVRGLGSSPLTRGKHQERRRLRDRLGLIPAHAGKTNAPLGRCMTSPAHPRSRGENRARDRRAEGTRGSSPLTRGKLRFTLVVPRAPRLIPAHAGKTFSVSTSTVGVWAHPRSRGENMSTAHAPGT